MKNKLLQINGLKTTNLLSCSSVGQKSKYVYWVKHKGSARLALLEGEEQVSWSFQLSRAVHIPWLWPPASNNLRSQALRSSHGHHITSLIPFTCSSFSSTLVIHPAHLDNSGHSPLSRQLIKSLWPCKVISLIPKIRMWTSLRSHYSTYHNPHFL